MFHIASVTSVCLYLYNLKYSPSMNKYLLLTLLAVICQCEDGNEVDKKVARIVIEACTG